MTLVLTALRVLVASVLVTVALLNLWRFNQHLSHFGARHEDPIVVWEDRLRGVRDALMRLHYMRGDVGYMSPSFLQGKRRSQDEDVRWCIVRYGLIPWNLVEDPLTAPYVVADFHGTNPVPEVPAGFTKFYDSGDGLFVLERAPRQ